MSSLRSRLAGPSSGRFSGETQIILLAAAAVVAAVAIMIELPGTPVLFGVATGLSALVIVSFTVNSWSNIVRARLPNSLRKQLEDVPFAAVLTDDGGFCIARNTPAKSAGYLGENMSLAAALEPHSVAATAIVNRLLAALSNQDRAEDVIGFQDARMRLRVHRLRRNRLLWTLTEHAHDTDLATLTVGRNGMKPNAAAAGFISADASALSDVVVDLPLRLGGKHKVQTASGDIVEMRIFKLPTIGETVEYALLPVRAEMALPGMSPVTEAVPDLLSILPVPMLKVSEDGALLEANAEARAILSIQSGELPPFFELVEGMGRSISDWLADAASGRGLLKPEIVRAVVPGQELYLQVTLGRMMDKGKIVLVGILNDATELKTLEAQFVQSQKMQAIGQLAGGVAHDFNNLLTAISGHCDLLLLRHDAGDPDYADLIQISHNSNRAASLVGQLLAFSRKQNLKPQALDLRDTMVDLAHLLNRLIGERIQLEVTHAPGPQTIRADRRQLEQVIVNLVVNARDAMPEGGKITVQTRSEFLAEETQRDHARLLPGDYVVIEVADAGTGIPPDALAKIFEPFFTTKKTGEGTGLGLSTAYGIVKQTGGFIFVESEMGQGTKFSLYFPATTAVEQPDTQDAQHEPTKPTQRTDAVILLVEDEAPVRAFASRALRLRGYSVIEAGDAEAALEILEDQALAVDLFVTDVVMPGMDGPTWVRKALKHRPDTGVVFMSGYAEEGRAEKQARIPNSVFLPKPFSLQQFTTLVQERLT